MNNEMNINNNPYTLMFGMEPRESISRVIQKAEVINAFSKGIPPQQIFMIMGVRGCGKTVFMTEVEKEFRNNEEWIVVDLNSSKDMLKALVAKLGSLNKLASIFQKANINLSLFGIGIEVSNSVPIVDSEVALIEMLESLNKHGKKVLITIDEVTPTNYMREFASAFQIIVRQKLPVYLLMSGLYENINSIQNKDNITFLFRAPKIELKPLNLGVIVDNYKKNFRIIEEEALKMARLTKGYGYAFQLLGYCTWNEGGNLEKAIKKYKSCLEDYVYEKIWSGLSNNDKRLAFGIAKSETGKVGDIRNIINMPLNNYSKYRERLMKQGFIEGSEYGYLSFTLPFFEEYVLRMYEQ